MTDSGERKRSGKLTSWLGMVWAEIKVVRLTWLEWSCAAFLILIGFSGLFATGYEHHLKKFKRDFVNYHFEEDYKVYREWSGLYLFYDWRESRVVYVNRIVIFGTKAPEHASVIHFDNGESILVPPTPRTYQFEYRVTRGQAVLVAGDQAAFELYRRFVYE